MDEMELAGGLNGGEIATGVGLVGGALIAGASAPVSVPLMAGIFLTSVAAGYFIEHGLMY